MTDSLDSASLDATLRRALRAQADQLLPEAVDRLRAIDFHPRAHRISPRLTIGAGAGVAACTAAAVSVLVVGGAPAAFAGWQATPTTPAAGQLAAAEAACRAQLPADSPASSVDGEGSSPILTDVRGPYTVAIYAGGSSDVTCFTGPSFTAVSGSSVTSTAHGSSAQGFGGISGASGAGPVSQSRSTIRPAPQSSSGSASGSAGGRAASGGGPGRGLGFGGAGNDISASHFTLSNGSPYTLVVGHTSDALTAALVERSSGSDVTATTADGWFEAWWPGTAQATMVKVTTSTGTTTLPIYSGPAGGPGGPGLGAGGAQQSS